MCMELQADTDGLVTQREWVSAVLAVQMFSEEAESKPNQVARIQSQCEDANLQAGSYQITAVTVGSDSVYEISEAIRQVGVQVRSAMSDEYQSEMERKVHLLLEVPLLPADQIERGHRHHLPDRIRLSSHSLTKHHEQSQQQKISRSRSCCLSVLVA